MEIGLFSERLRPSGLGKVVSFGWQAAWQADKSLLVFEIIKTQ